MLRSDRVMLSVMCVFEAYLAICDFLYGFVLIGIFASLSVAFGCAVLIRTTWRR